MMVWGDTADRISLIGAHTIDENCLDGLPNPSTQIGELEGKDGEICEMGLCVPRSWRSRIITPTWNVSPEDRFGRSDRNMEKKKKQATPRLDLSDAKSRSAKIGSSGRFGPIAEGERH